MIGRLEGILLEKQAPTSLVDVNGVGYEVDVSMNTLYRLPDHGQKVILYTQHIVREDAQLLYGFFDKAERSLFRALVKVNGVGPKSALAILSSVLPHEFIQYVRDGNSGALIRLPGIGKKTAERLLIEMRDRVKDDTGLINDSIQIASGAVTSFKNSCEQEAVSALIALGYKPQEASKAVAKIDVTDLSSAEIIRRALQLTVKQE